MARHLRPRGLRTRPHISVVIPCYNYAQFLRDAVASATGQPGVDVEIIICDNASTDGSAEIARELSGADARVTVIEQPANVGYARNANDGLAAATGEYLVFLHADDLLAPGSLARAAAVLEALPDVGFAYGYVPGFYDRPPRPLTAVLDWQLWSGQEWIDRICHLGRGVVKKPAACLMRRPLAEAAGGWDPVLTYSADTYLWMCLATGADVCQIAPAHQAFGRIHADSASAVESVAQTLRPLASTSRRCATPNPRLADITYLAELRLFFELFFSRYGDRIPDAQRKYETALAGVARAAVSAARQWYDHAMPGEDQPEKLLGLAQSLTPDIVRTAGWRRVTRLADRRRQGRRRRVSQNLRAALDAMRADVGARLGR